jgi:hypothetical protein
MRHTRIQCTITRSHACHLKATHTYTRSILRAVTRVFFTIANDWEAHEVTYHKAIKYTVTTYFTVYFYMNYYVFRIVNIFRI